MKYRLKKDLPWAKAGSEHDEGSTRKMIIDLIFQDLRKPYDFSDWFEPIEERWKPKEGEDYWALDLSPEIKVGKCIWPPFDKAFLPRCFRTREQAEEAAKRVKKCLEDYHNEIGE